MIEEADIKVLLDVGEFSSRERVRHLAASDSGRRILVAARRRFDKAKQYGRETLIGEELNRRAEPAGTAVGTSTQDKIDVLNQIIEGEDSFQRMLYNDWLKLPVTVYRSGYEEDGGVYYNPSLKGTTTLGKKPGSVPAGKTEAHALLVRSGGVGCPLRVSSGRCRWTVRAPVLVGQPAPGTLTD